MYEFLIDEKYELALAWLVIVAMGAFLLANAAFFAARCAAPRLMPTKRPNVVATWVAVVLFVLALALWAVIFFPVRTPEPDVPPTPVGSASPTERFSLMSCSLSSCSSAA